MFFGCAFRKGAVALFFGVLTVGMIGETAQAQDEDPEDCTILCSPELALEPAVDFEPVVGAARTVEFEGGQPVDTTEAELETPFELTLAMGIPTQWPRLELGIDASWTPTTDANKNPFTGEDGSVTENPVELSGEISITALREADTGGWVGAEVSVADELGPAERPGDDRWYTHKLALALDVAVLPFHQLEHAGYLQGVELETSLDFTATGIPQEGDRFSNELFLDDESPWGVSMALVLPLAPLN